MLTNFVGSPGCEIWAAAIGGVVAAQDAAVVVDHTVQVIDRRRVATASTPNVELTHV